MKETTKLILEWFNNEHFENQLLQTKTNSFDYLVNETTIEEAYEEFEYCKQIILASIEKQTFDKITFTKRNQILSFLNNISNYLNQLNRWSYNIKGNSSANASGNAIISSILSLRDLIDSSQLARNLSGYYKYSEQTKELNKIKRRYNNLIKSIENAEVLNRQVIGTSDIIKKQSEELLELINQINSKSENVNEIQNQVKSQLTSLVAIVQDSENKKLKINSIFENSENIENTFNESDKTLKNLISELKKMSETFLNSVKEDYDLNAKDLNERTNKIVTKNVELQKKINSLLEGANAGRLYKSFHWRKKQLEDKLWLWFSGIILTNLSLVALAILIINGSETLGISKIDTSNLDGAFYMKLLISIPLIFLDYFFINQYNSRKYLIEKYSFKSVLSLSILAYNEMLKENSDSDISQKFIIDTVERIYESPFDQQKLTKKELDVVNNLAQKGLDHLNNFTNGIVKPSSN